jgi:uncharacterized SAM-binding protein YcdF (DUF218 family)
MIAMFFLASKVVWYLLQPSTLLAVLLILGLALYRLGRRAAAMRVLAAMTGVYAAGGLLPIGNAMMLSLEQQYPRPTAGEIGQVDGIIVLGGMIDTRVAGARDELALNEAAERLTEAATLAYRFPKARIVISGGSDTLLYEGIDEATVSARFLTSVGVDPARLTLETRSRNTWQNAIFTKALVTPKPGERWLLVTSAFHMPRAMGCFRAAGLGNVIPWPVDFRTRGPADLLRFPSSVSDAWRRIDLVIKEWLGDIAYYLTGKLA